MIVARGGKRGKTAGRGGKGQTARAGNKRRPEWRDIIKKLPKLRGRGVNQNKPVSEKAVVINLSAIESAFSNGDAITPTILVEKGIVSTLSGNIPKIKILGDGEITKTFKISGCLVSGSAQTKIEKSGGSVELYTSRIIAKNPGPSLSDDISSASGQNKENIKAKTPKTSKKKESNKSSENKATKKL